MQRSVSLPVQDTCMQVGYRSIECILQTASLLIPIFAPQLYRRDPR